MKANRTLLSLVLLSSVLVALALTASDYVDCKDLGLDEFLDMAFESPYSVSPVFDPLCSTHPFSCRPLKIFYFQRTNLLTTFRCLSSIDLLNRLFFA